MKIAIACLKNAVDSEVSQIAGRAPYYLIFEKGQLVKSIKNPFVVGGGGAGFGVTKMLADGKIKLVIAGKFGENMKIALNNKQIRFKETTKNIKEILKENK